MKSWMQPFRFDLPFSAAPLPMATDLHPKMFPRSCRAKILDSNQDSPEARASILAAGHEIFDRLERMADTPVAHLDAIDQICAAITAVLPQVHAAQVSSVVKKEQSPKIAVKASPRVTARAIQKQKQSSTVAVKASKERIPVKAAPAVLRAISDILKAAPRAKEAVSMDPAWEHARSRQIALQCCRHK